MKLAFLGDLRRTDGETDTPTPESIQPFEYRLAWSGLAEEGGFASQFS